MFSSDLNEAKQFTECREKVRVDEVLSPTVEHLLRAIRFTGRVSVVQNGRILKSGYEEGYFRSRPG
jgi:hypothetical protein